MGHDNVRAALTRIVADATLALASLPVDQVRTVRAGDSLQAALDAADGSVLELEAGAQWGGTYVLRSGTRLVGRGGNTIRGLRAPALMVAPGSVGVSVSAIEATSTGSEVIRIGENDDTQTTASDAPSDVTFDRVSVPSHLGKRAFAIHGRRVRLLDCRAVNVWDLSGQDSQAIYIGNAPGELEVRGGEYSAGSEVVLVGGDTTRIPGCVPTGITVEGVTLFRPLTWQSDGVNRKVKNLFELKSGRTVVVRNCRMFGCWQQAQAGWAFVLTPTLDGAVTTTPKPSGIVEDVLIEDNVVSHVGSIFQVQGRDYSSFTDPAVNRVIVRRNVFATDRLRFGGFGQLARMGAEPTDMAFEDNVVLTDGSSTVYYYRGTLLQADGTKRVGGNIDLLRFERNRIAVGQYGFNLDGYANAREWARAVNRLEAQGNTFGGSAQMAGVLPDNSYLTSEAFEAVEAVTAARAAVSDATLPARS